MQPTPDSQLPVPQGPARLPAQPTGPFLLDTGSEAPAVPLTHYIWLIRRSFKKIAAFVLAVLAATIVVTYRMTPVYEATVTLDVDRRGRTDVLGRDSGPVSPIDSDQFLATQVRLIQSDSVLRPVADKFRLLERPEEQIDKTAEDRSKNADSPVLLKGLHVVRPPNTYLLMVSYRSTDRRLAADVANAIAQSYLEHTYRIRYKEAAGLSRFMEKQLEELRTKMEQSSGALGKFERELNIIQPEEKTNILGTRLIDLNSEYTRAQSDRVKKEAAFRSVADGNVEAVQVSSQREALRKLTDDLNAARQRFAEVKTKYGVNHPEHKAASAHLEEIRQQLESTQSSIRKRVEVEFREAENREKAFEGAVADTKKELDRLNSRSFQYQNLKREAEGDKKLYEELLRRIKEETINSSFQSNSIRVADPARPARKPVTPNVPLNLALAAIFSTILAVGSVILHDVLDDTVREPEDVARTFGTDVIGSLPQVKQWQEQTVALSAPGGLTHVSASSQLSAYEEAIRSLRNSILLKDFERRVRTLMFTSSTPSEGKSTAATHLAVAHAMANHRTLLIDGDLRRPTVHQRFGVENSRGLSDVLIERASWREMVTETSVAPGLKILTAGPASPRKAADFLGPCLSQILEEAYADYDLIILDAPPLLGFPECLQMAAAVDGVVIVAKAGETSRKGVATVVTTLERIGANILGVVLNHVNQKISDTYYYYGYYGKYYGHYYGRPKV